MHCNLEYGLKWWRLQNRESTLVLDKNIKIVGLEIWVNGTISNHRYLRMNLLIFNEIAFETWT